MLWTSHHTPARTSAPQQQEKGGKNQKRNNTKGRKPTLRIQHLSNARILETEEHKTEEEKGKQQNKHKGNQSLILKRLEDSTARDAR